MNSSTVDAKQGEPSPSVRSVVHNSDNVETGTPSAPPMIVLSNDDDVDQREGVEDSDSNDDEHSKILECTNNRCILLTFLIFIPCIYFNVWSHQYFLTCKSEYREEYSTFYIHRVRSILIDDKDHYLTFQYELTVSRDSPTIYGTCVFDYFQHVERLRNYYIGQSLDLFISVNDLPNCKFVKTSYDWMSKCSRHAEVFAFSIVSTILFGITWFCFCAKFTGA